MNGAVFQIVRLVAVIALVCVAGALATPPGRLPLALRGLQRILRQDRGNAPAAAEPRASLCRRLIALLLVVVAAVIALVSVPVGHR